jgi:hypothetical protein
MSVLVSLACLIATALAPAAGSSLPAEVVSVEPGRPAVAAIGAAGQARRLSILVSLEQPGHLPVGGVVQVHVVLGKAALEKTLHLGDPDAVWSVGQPAGTAGEISLVAGDGIKDALRCAVRVSELGDDQADGVAFETEPNDAPETANPLKLGQTLYGWADDRPYLPLGEELTGAESTSGKDWFRFEFDSETPRLAFFALDYVDRDVPPDVRVYQIKDGKLVEYTIGIDPQSRERERPPRPGANKFTTRVLTRGTYFLQVDACQPDYQLRTRLYDVPPFLRDDQAADPEAIAAAAGRAVRTAMDFQLLAGESWHANTPRKGHTLDRVANFHHETSTCIGCHATHFTTQSALSAVRNGYRIEQPFAMRFLAERLANNPVPFHGYPDALWARVIPAPANVMGRLSTIVMDYEDLVAGSPHNHLHRGISEFLKLYYDGRTTIPPDESNGNNPVSRYKVAADAWRQLDEVFRRGGDARYAETRDLVARLLPMGAPAHMRDLAAQTIGLCLAGRARFDAQIQANVQRILSLQLPGGQWAITFDPKALPAQMQTGECLYALSLAGLPEDHPAIRKGIIALLREQKPFGGWFDLNPYEQFRTPFRETQWSLMALARVYPGPGTQGWNNPLGPAPWALRVGLPGTLIQDLERVWDPPPPALLQSILAQLDHALPQVRLAACSTLARVGGETSIDPLVTRLADESKAVRRAAAEALRSIGNRLNADHAPGATAAQKHLVAALTEALRSPDDRMRRGATRAFAAHFRELSQELSLADALRERLDDPDPVVAMQAIKGLWRIWYWRPDRELRNGIEDALIARLAQPRHPWVRRNLIEALYIIGDENIRYLYNNWVPSLASKERQDRATAAQHATVNRLGEKYVAVLARGNLLQREGVLRAMSEFFERPVLGGRIGNDLEPMLFYDDALPRVTAALAGQLSDASPTIRRLALQALVTLRGSHDPSLERAVLARQGDDDRSVRDWAATMAGQFPLELLSGKPDPALQAVVDGLLASELPRARAAALDVIGRWGPVTGSDRSAALRLALSDDEPEARAAAWRALGSFPALLADAAIKKTLEGALADADPESRVAGLRLALDGPGLVPDRALRKALEDESPGHRLALLALIEKRKQASSDLRLVGVVSNALVDDNTGVREKALQVIQARPELVANPAVDESLRELSRSPNARQKEIAQTLLRTRGRSSAGGGALDTLDIAYFEARVLPIFNALGDDGQNCMGCHRSHTILKMVQPDREGRWSAEAVRANFRATLRVVNLADPPASLLLGKPTWEAAEEAEAQKDPTRKAHTGGVRFETKTSQEYQTILDWINGARLNPHARAEAR